MSEAETILSDLLSNRRIKIFPMLIAVVQTIVLLLAANGAPILLNKAFGKRWMQPIDNGLLLGDGNPLFGQAKTWRGLFAAMAATSLAALSLGLPAQTGIIFGILTMTGDLSASFVKRRMKLAESSRATGLDTVPEALLPAWCLQESLSLDFTDILVVVALFFLIDEWLSPLLYRWHIRKRPY